MTNFKITTITAFIAVDEDGDEGVMGVLNGDQWIPLICADEERIRILFPVAENIARVKNIPYRVIQLSVRTDVTDEIKAKYGTDEKET